MKTKKFYKIFYLISNYIHQDNKVIDLLCENEWNYSLVFLDRFKEELDKNILRSVSAENKSDIIKFYLFKLKQLESYFNYNKDLLFQEPFFEKSLSKGEAYINICHYIYDQIFTEIQYCCGKYNIDFWLLCEEVGLDLMLFDSGITAFFNESNDKQIKISPKYENIFSNNGFLLFEHILSNYVKENRGRLSDIHYFYWVMFNDSNQYIHQRPKPFSDWYFKKYNEDLGKIKVLTDVKSPDRDKHYSNALEWFKQQSN